MPANCSLFLEVYEDDRTTVAWTVSTDPAEPLPYLIDPMRYGEQQIDVAKGAATIGTVTVGVIDPATIAGDQDSGWMTARLAAVHGHRCRLRRYIDAAYVVIADGPAGEPKLEPDYASYLWEIRDTRETERKVRAFEDVEPTTSAWPIGIVAAFGTIPAIAPNVGRVRMFSPESFRRLDFGPAYWASGTGSPALNGSTIVDPEAVLTPELEALLQPPTMTHEGGTVYRHTYENLTIMWRETGSGDPYTVVRDPYFLRDENGPVPAAQSFFTVRDGTLADGRKVRAVWRTATLTVGWSFDFYALPLGTDIDVIVLAHGPASKSAPVHVSGLTAGEFAQNVYDGVYSPRDEDGNIVPTGIRYDAAALALMTTPVSLRLFEPIKDARDWLEKYIYTPTGWVPALDSEGRISPVSQVAPADDTGLPVINNAITEPRPSWGLGSRIINIIRFTYPRDYLPDSTITVTKTGDGLAERPVEIEFRDEASISRHGEQVLQIDGRAFRAIGTAAGSPVGDDITAEVGYQLAQLRNTHVKGRYTDGAPSFPVTVMRSGTPTVRAGSFVAVDLSWLPNPYVTGRRGLTGIGQALSIADLDCAWRELLIEMVPPPPPPPVAPGAIADLAASAFSHSRIDLTWTLPAGATGVKLYRSTSTGFTPGAGNIIATLGAVESYQNSTGLSPSTAYYYRAIAFNAVGDAPQSNEATATTPAVPVAPDLVSASSAEIDPVQCTVDGWTVAASWVTTGADDTNFRIDIDYSDQASPSTWFALVTHLTTASSSFQWGTGIQGTAGGGSNGPAYFTARVKLVNRSTLQVVEQITTNTLTSDQWGDCA